MRSLFSFYLEETVDKQGIANSYNNIGNVYISHALENYKLYIVYYDSLLNEENTKKTIQMSMTYEFDKKEMLAKTQQETRYKKQKPRNNA